MLKVDRLDFNNTSQRVGSGRGYKGKRGLVCKLQMPGGKELCIFWMFGFTSADARLVHVTKR